MSEAMQGGHEQAHNRNKALVGQWFEGTDGVLRPDVERHQGMKGAESKALSPEEAAALVNTSTLASMNVAHVMSTLEH